MNIEEWKIEHCKFCEGFEDKSCCDLDGDLLDEQIKECIKNNSPKQEEVVTFG